jgi:hypothetical protein
MGNYITNPFAYAAKETQMIPLKTPTGHFEEERHYEEVKEGEKEMAICKKIDEITKEVDTIVDNILLKLKIEEDEVFTTISVIESPEIPKEDTVESPKEPPKASQKVDELEAPKELLELLEIFEQPPKVAQNVEPTPETKQAMSNVLKEMSSKQNKNNVNKVNNVNNVNKVNNVNNVNKVNNVNHSKASKNNKKRKR